MFLRPKRNRRRVDIAKRSGELKASARAHAPLVLKVLGAVLLSAGLLGASFVGWRWASTSERFGLKALIVEGAHHTTEAELARLGGLGHGRNLLSIDVEAVERALSTHPWVRQVRVRRELPSRLVVELEEYHPVALLALGELYLVDDRGQPFKRATVNDELDLPLVTGVDREDFTGDRARALEVLARAVNVADAYCRLSGQKKGDLSEVHVELDEVTVVTVDGQEVHLGAGDLEPKLQRLKKVRAELDARALKAEVIRLDNRARPTWVAVQLSGAPVDKGNHR